MNRMRTGRLVLAEFSAVYAVSLAGFWQEAAPLDGVSPSIPGEGGGGGSGAASFSQQWGPSVVAAAGSGPSRLKELLPFFRWTPSQC